ncbi:MAG: ATP-grasp domain-containing protein [Aggregatilineales bacterium]
MKIIFCCDTLNPDSPDPMYIDEVAAATRQGLDFELVDYQELVAGNAARAVRDIATHDTPETAIYRGWMLTAKQYAGLYDALYSRGLQLINTISAYKLCHHLPDSLHLIADHTAATVWTQGTQDLSDNALMMLLQPFGEKAVVLKDYVKSQKHYWDEACYIPDASDIDGVQARVRRFLQLQDNDIVGGLVFREFIDYEPLGNHPQSGMPMIQEYRIVYYQQQPIAIMRYWDVDGYDDALEPSLEQFNTLAKTIESDFFTLDVAKCAGQDSWMIIEPGDGQVAGLPDNADKDAFYQALAKK